MFNFLATLHLQPAIDRRPRLDFGKVGKQLWSGFGARIPEKWCAAIWSTAGWVFIQISGAKKTGRLSHTCFRRLHRKNWKEVQMSTCEIRLGGDVHFT